MRRCWLCWLWKHFALSSWSVHRASRHFVSAFTLRTTQDCVQSCREGWQHQNARLWPQTRATQASALALLLPWLPLKVDIWKMLFFCLSVKLSLFLCSTRWCWHRRLTKRTAVSLGELKQEGEKKRQKCWQIYSHLQSVSKGRWPTEYNKTGFQFQDPTSLKWFYLTIGVNRSSLDDFKKSARISSGSLGSYIGKY